MKLAVLAGAKMFMLCGTLLAEGQPLPPATSERQLTICTRSFLLDV